MSHTRGSGVARPTNQTARLHPPQRYRHPPVRGDPSRARSPNCHVARGDVGGRAPTQASWLWIAVTGTLAASVITW
jgi:hypothetical protein